MSDSKRRNNARLRSLMKRRGGRAIDGHVHFGGVGRTPAHWRGVKLNDHHADDEELAQTPPDVVEMLGFDPKEKA